MVQLLISLVRAFNVDAYPVVGVGIEIIFSRTAFKVLRAFGAVKNTV
jgi:hypothetical protein